MDFDKKVEKRKETIYERKIMMKRKSNFFIIISVMITIGGLIFGIVLGNVCKYDYSSWSSSPKYMFNVGLMFQTWIISDIISLAFYWMACVLGKMENIEMALGAENNSGSFLSEINNRLNNRNTVVNSADNNSFGHVETPDNVDTVSPQNVISGDDEWVCPNCGNVHKNFVGSCGCGQMRPK